MPALLGAVPLDELADLGCEVRLELEITHLQVLEQLLRQCLHRTARARQRAGSGRQWWNGSPDVALLITQVMQDVGGYRTLQKLEGIQNPVLGTQLPSFGQLLPYH